ncbi:MAG: putative lipid II flippase FtsW [Acidobacteriota bacterium]|jgi:cell division protein FtsW
MASRWLGIDKLLFATTVAMISFGLLMVYSSSYHESQQDFGAGTHYLWRQAIAAVIGLAIMLIALRIDYRIYQRRPMVALAVIGTLALLVLVLLIGTGANTHRWFALGPFRLQPSEIAKFATVLFLASYLARKDDQLDDWWQGLFPPLAVVGVYALLILREPDLGTAAALVLIAGIMLTVAGLRWRYIVGFGSVGVVAVAAQITMTGYQTRRILAFLNPWADPRDVGFQTVQSLIAVGAGGITGVGLTAGKQKLDFLPAPHTDFIYAVIGEELGLVGSVLIVAGFMVILWRGLRAATTAPDKFGFYLGIGLTAGLVMQALLNMSVVVNLMPTTGITLPLISYGGSSLVATCAAIGVLLNISQHS